MSPLYWLAAQIDADKAGIPKMSLGQATVDGILASLFGVAGVVCIIFIVLGGVKYTVSQGNSGDLQKAKDTILYAVIGLVIVFASYGVINFILGRF